MSRTGKCRDREQIRGCQGRGRGGGGGGRGVGGGGGGGAAMVSDCLMHNEVSLVGDKKKVLKLGCGDGCTTS